MLYMTHYEDKNKEHSIGFKYLDSNKNLAFAFPTHSFKNGFVNGTDITSLTSRGATKEEAINNIGEMLDYLIRELNAIRNNYDNGLYEDNIVEVDCCDNVKR